MRETGRGAVSDEKVAEIEEFSGENDIGKVNSQRKMAAKAKLSIGAVNTIAKKKPR